MANKPHGTLSWMVQPPSRWTVTENDREPSDPAQHEIRRRIDEVWRIKAANGGAYPRPAPEDARKVRCRAQCRVLRAIVDALPSGGSEVRRSDLLRSLGIWEPTMKKATALLLDAGLVETGVVSRTNARWYRLTATRPVTDAELESIAWQSIRGRQEAAA